MPHAAPGLVPTLAWARGHDIHWAEGSTVVQGIGQGYTQVTPLALATMIARIASGMAVGPHIARRVGGDLQTGSDPDDWLALDVDDRDLATIRQALFAAVNTPAGTAYASRLTLPNVQMSGKTGTAQVHNNSAAEKMKNFNDLTMAWEDRPNGNFGAQSAAPLARDVMTYALTTDPAGRDTPLEQKLSDASPS
jgi:penicillin-binding protein 2